MRVVYPYTSRHPYTVAAAPDHAEWRDVSEDAHAYWRLFCELWADGESFVVVEHDVALVPGVLEQFERCPEPWCANPYDNICHWGCMEAWANMLGCTRFTADLIRATPDAVSSIPESERGWHNLCDHIAGNKLHGVDQPTLRPGSLRAAGFTHHWHFPPVRHHQGVQSPHRQDDMTISVDWAQVAKEQGWNLDR